jgi:hypothetical protein
MSGSSEDDDRHGCRGKIRIIHRRTQVLLNHDQITWLCGEWGCVDRSDFYRQMDGMSDSELKAWAERARKRKKALEAYLAQEAKIYV